MKKETLEEAAEMYVLIPMSWTIKEIFKDGVKWQQQNSYCEEEVLAFCEWFAYEIEHYNYPTNKDIIKALEQFKKK